MTREMAAGAVVDRAYVKDSSVPKDFACLEVTDTLQAYQQIAGCYRQTLDAKVVAITGSNGKTSTKDLTAAILGVNHRVSKTQGNFNNHVGVPRTLLEVSREDEFVVLEIGMNHPGEIAPLANIAAPQVAIVTNIGSAHLEYMKTRAAIAEEKGALLASLGAQGHAILPAEDEFADVLSRRTEASKITVGFSRGDVRAENLRATADGTHFNLVEGSTSHETFLSVTGRHMVLNGLLAVAAARSLGVPLADCISGLASVRLTKGRLERKNVAGFQILDDSYNANPDSMVAALQTLSELPIDGKRIAVLGKMGELGEESEAGHWRVGRAAATANLSQLIVVGAEAVGISHGAREAGMRSVECVPTVEAAAERLRESARPSDLILIKGSRSAGMERVYAALEANAATTTP